MKNRNWVKYPSKSIMLWFNVLGTIGVFLSILAMTDFFTRFEFDSFFMTNTLGCLSAMYTITLNYYKNTRQQAR